MDLTIRPIRQAEFETVGELVAEVYLADGLLHGGAGDPYAAVLRNVAHRAEHAEVLVAADGAGGATGTVLGAVTFAAHGSPYAELAGPGEGEFRMLAVRPEGRGRGIGEALVRACLERARALGLRGMVLSSQRHLLPAHRLYGRLGFARAAERDWEPVPGLALWAFARELA
ncbi:GNAT family N-acetyltransferase [Streptomyces sp. BHT-5-2]|uniref:GNAT family N-acetyltransferase n=1 Tax=unclassified Streptomyces TaxID=2593676 RepID=UPI001C8D006F|nr:GNAT family N-acetyltransferase [Streptomyces sp. BHT-5-2]QZL03870.1 GNAT family N-acetyltransferase [Streptomyces sp. BHT-5-2]